MTSEDNTKWGRLNKIKYTHFKRSPLRTWTWSNTPTLSPFHNLLSTCCALALVPILPPNRAVTNSDNFSMARTINAIISSFKFFFRVLTCFSFFSWDSSSICLHILFHHFSRYVFDRLYVNSWKIVSIIQCYKWQLKYLSLTMTIKWSNIFS